MKNLQQSHTEKINCLLEQISSLQEELTASKDEAEKLPALEKELEVVNQSHADLKKHLEALEKIHSSTIEIKSNLENTMNEKNNLICNLEKASKESANHAVEVENMINKEKILKEKLEAARKLVNASKTESSTRRVEIKTMKTTLSAASHGLEERDNEIKSLKEKLNNAEAEQAKTSDLSKEKMVAMHKIKVGY